MSSPPPASRPQQGITKHALQSGVWLWMRQQVSNLVSIGTTAILARHLPVSAFGIVAAALVTLRFLTVLSKGGVGDFVVCDDGEGREERASAAFWLNVTMTSVATLAGACAIPIVWRTYHSPLLAQVLAVFLFKFWVDELSVVPEAVIKRSLDYEKLVLRDGTIDLFSSLASAGLAVAGFGVWSLVLPHFVTSPAKVITVYLMAKWRPALHAGRRHWRRIWKFSASVIGANVAVAIANDGDTLVVGKVLGSRALGLYNTAYATTGLLLQNTVGVVGSLALPSLAAVAADPPRLRAAIRRMIRVLSIVSMPAFVGMFVLADVFMLALYGNHFREAILPLRILIVFAIRRAIGSPLSSAFNAVGRPEVGMRLSLALVPLFVASVIIGTHWGVVGVAVAVTLTRTLWGFVMFKAIFDLIDESGLAMWRQVAPVLYSSILMGVMVWGARLALARVVVMAPVAELFAMSGLGVLVYIVLLRIAFTRVRDDVVNLAAQINKRLGRIVALVIGKPAAAA